MGDTQSNKVSVIRLKGQLNSDQFMTLWRRQLAIKLQKCNMPLSFQITRTDMSLAMLAGLHSQQEQHRSVYLCCSSCGSLYVEGPSLIRPIARRNRPGPRVLCCYYSLFSLWYDKLLMFLITTLSNQTSVHPSTASSR